jgi:ATP-binding cassette subfamily B protein
VDRLNGTTIKILGLELKKGTLHSFIKFYQGTTVHFMRTGLVLPCICLFFKGFYLGFNNIDVLLFLLFNPLQELGNVIATYNETKVSMIYFADLMNSKAKRSQQVQNNRSDQSFALSNISFKHQSAASYAVQTYS